MKNLIVSLSMFMILSGVVFGQQATLSIEAVGSVEPGNEITFQVKCDEIDDEVSTFQWFFLYDPKVMTPIEVVNYHEGFPHYEWMNNLEYAENVIILTWLSTKARNQPMKTGETICELRFKYIGGEAELKWAKTNSVTKTSEKVFTAMWTEVGKAYYLKLINAEIKSEE